MRRLSVVRAVPIAALAGVVAACASGPPPAPAPVILKGADAGVPPVAYAAPYRSPSPLYRPPPSPRPAPEARAEGRRIVVRPGQSLGGIAHAYRVPERTIIAANRLQPPYKLEIGQTLLLPGAGEALSEAPAAEHQRTAEHPPAPVLASHRSPEIIPLDGPAPALPPAPPPAARPQRSASLSPPAAAEPGAGDEARGAPAPAVGPAAPLHEGRFPWPVQGHVVESYGATAGGGHNDGINIAAPRGTPVRAVDGGTVAYAGNELRGYGNLVLIKHPDGWITAYAHCEELLVRRGERVKRGQVIAKVGETGGVSQPQLHFELRRGKRAVDPRAFLVPAPSAWRGEATQKG